MSKLLDQIDGDGDHFPPFEALQAFAEAIHCERAAAYLFNAARHLAFVDEEEAAKNLHNAYALQATAQKLMAGLPKAIQPGAYKAHKLTSTQEKVLKQWSKRLSN